MWSLPNGKKFLSDVSTQKLRSMYAVEQHPKSKLRLLAALHRRKGESIDSIARMLSKSRRTVHGWLTRFTMRGIMAKDAIRQTGRPSQMTIAQRRQLVKYLERGPPHNATGLWSTKDVQELLRRKYNIVFVKQHVWRMLDQLGFSLLRPRKSHHRRADASTIAAFKKKTRKLVREYRKRHFVIAAQDEATFGLIPIVARGWARRGSNPTVTINHKNVCTNVFGARTQKGFAYKFSKRKRQREFIVFLRYALKRWGRILLFVDNGPAHHGKRLEGFCQKHKKTLRIEYFPAYSPELNPIEQCWKPARDVLANRLLHTLPAAKYHLRKKFNNPKEMPKMFQYFRD